MSDFSLPGDQLLRDLREMADAEDAKEAARPFLMRTLRRCFWFRNRLRKRFVHPTAQRFRNLRHGFFGPDVEVLEFHTELARYALPRLKYFAANVSGYPTSGSPSNVQKMALDESDAPGIATWQERLADMIYWLERVRDNPRTLDVRTDPRYRRGKYYFFRYFEALWD